MSEKVLFEFRVEEDEDGYTVVFKHDKETFPGWYPAIRKRFSERAMKYNRKHHMLSKRRMRRRLDFYEGMYEDIYGPQEKGVKQKSKGKR